MSRAVLFVVDSNEEGRERVISELRKRYASDYDVVVSDSEGEGLALLAQMAGEEIPVVAILAEFALPPETGIAFLQKARRLHPRAQRGLLFEWGDISVADELQRGLALGIVDAYSPRPMTEGDEHFHNRIAEFLHTWAMQHDEKVVVARIVGEQWAPRCHELRDLLERNSILYAFHSTESDTGRALLKQYGVSEDRLPIVVMADGSLLENPSNVELAQALNVSTTYAPRGAAMEEAVDVVIVGAGPAGLSAAVYSASEGLRTVVIENTALGGQAGMSSRIRNYLGFPLGISGNELAGRAYQQAWMFGAQFTFAQSAVGLRVDGEERTVTLSDGAEIRTRAVILALGVTYRRLRIAALDRLIGAGVFYGAADTEAQAMRGQPVFVVGGGNSAGQAAVHLARFAGRVTMVVRGRSLASGMSDYLIQEIEESSNIEVRPDTEIVGGGGDYRLEHLVLQDRTTGAEETVEASGLFVLIGAVPSTDWLPAGIERSGPGYIVTGQDLVRDGEMPRGWPLSRPPLLLETSIPRVFACGDVRFRSVKRVASAVGEGSIAVQLLHQVLNE